MENRSHAIIAGLFVLVLLAAAAITAIWIGRKNVTYEPFELVSQLPVGGLSVQSQVRYQGMPVGQVQGLGFDQENPGSIRISIGVLPQTPVTKGTWAEISTQGVTGISNIDLRDDGRDPEKVVSTPSKPYLIPVRPGFFQRLQSAGVDMVSDFEGVLRQLESFVTKENATAFTEIMNNTRTLTASLNQSVIKLEPTLQELPGLARDLKRSLEVFDGMGNDVSSLVKSAQTTIDMLNSSNGPIGQAALSLKQLERSAAQLQSSVLPEVNRVLESLSRASRTFDRTMREVERAPQSLLFGAPEVRPGPGEPGFDGFNQ
ncbi:MlaD family protein [Orrella marina]|uniref:MCE family protein n=1 Tax=Orrella marina TaxID=2163011 RepID=A0A2R4XLA8_9BURK|nr:MlaD family protein [Orrella marina]AWB34590.1 MCE family protein [Orrella marina]